MALTIQTASMFWGLLGAPSWLPTRLGEGSIPSGSTTFKATLLMALTTSRIVITTAEAVATRTPIIGIPAVDLKEIHSDLSQLPYRLP